MGDHLGILCAIAFAAVVPCIDFLESIGFFSFAPTVIFKVSYGEVGEYLIDHLFHSKCVLTRGLG